VLVRSVTDATLPLARLAHRLSAAKPRLERLQRELRELRARLVRAEQLDLERRAQRQARLGAHLMHLDPRQVLARGYSIVSVPDGRIVRSSAEVRAGDAVRLEFGQGAAGARITDTQ
jgi:exodeoxyribonuclease VII large subunit